MEMRPSSRGTTRRSRRRRVVEITAAIIEGATELRAVRVRSPDAIHLATAIDGGADVFITGDASLARCTEIADTR